MLAVHPIGECGACEDRPGLMLTRLAQQIRPVSMSSSRDIDVIAAASASGSVNVNVLDIRYPLPRSVIEPMGTSVRRGTDKTGPTNAGPEKSVDNYFSTRVQWRRCGCDTCHLAGSRGSPHAARTSTIGGGASVGQEMRRRSTPGVPCHRSLFASPAEPEPAPVQAVSRLAARGSHLDHRRDGGARQSGDGGARPLIRGSRSGSGTTARSWVDDRRRRARRLLR